MQHLPLGTPVFILRRSLLGCTGEGKIIYDCLPGKETMKLEENGVC